MIALLFSLFLIQNSSAEMNANYILNGSSSLMNFDLVFKNGSTLQSVFSQLTSNQRTNDISERLIEVSTTLLQQSSPQQNIFELKHVGIKHLLLIPEKWTRRTFYSQCKDTITVTEATRVCDLNFNKGDASTFIQKENKSGHSEIKCIQPNATGFVHCTWSRWSKNLSFYIKNPQELAIMNFIDSYTDISISFLMIEQQLNLVSDAKKVFLLSDFSKINQMIKMKTQMILDDSDSLEKIVNQSHSLHILNEQVSLELLQ